MEALKHDDAQVRSSAALALSEMKPEEVGAAVQLLIWASTVPDQGVRTYAAQALGKQKNLTLLPYLLELFKEENSGMKIVVLHTLADMGRVTIPVLIEALTDDHERVVIGAATA